MNRKGPWEGYPRQTVNARCLLPGFLCAHIFIERERERERKRRLGTWQHLNDMGTTLSWRNRSIDPDRLSCLESFPIQKLLIFLILSLSINVEKV